MQISLRSHLIAGTAAVVGASAIAVTPVTAAHLDLPTIKAPAVALKAFTPPLVALAGTLFQAGSYLFNTDAPVDDAASWPFANFGDEFGTPPVNIPGIVPLVLGPEVLPGIGLGINTSVGLIPQIIDDALPIISQLGYNGSDYLQATLGALYASTDYLVGGIWEAAGQLLSFDIQGAFDTILTSISQTGSILLTAGGYVLSGVVNRATAVVEALIGGLGTVVGATLRQLQVIGDSVGTVFNNVFDAFGGPNPIEGAWNALVEGLLGANGIPGTIVNLTIGSGVQTGPITGATPEEIQASIEANFVPSIRTEVRGLVQAVTAALQTPVSGAAAVAPAAAAEVEAPAAAVEVEAPAAGAAAEAVEVSAADVKADTKAAEAAPAAEVSAADVKAEAATGEAAAEEAPAAEAPAAEAPAAPAAEAGEAKSAETPKRANRGAAKRGAAA